LEAIQMNRGESGDVAVMRPAVTKCQRSTESAHAQPTHDPVEPWSLIVHQVARRSFAAGMLGAASTISASAAVSNVQSSSGFCEGFALRILFGCRLRAGSRLRAGFRLVVFRGLATGHLLGR
jgi:hypothetical protein